MYAVEVFVDKDLDLSCLENGNIGKMLKENIKIEHKGEFYMRFASDVSYLLLTRFKTRNQLSAMEEIETQIHRLPNLKKWFVEIFAKPA